MRKKETNDILFPVDKNEADSLKQLSEKLTLMAVKNKPVVGTDEISNDETIADDFDASPDEIKKIQNAENDMRSLLKAMDVDYDTLIRMDNKSVYSRAVAANPAILEFVRTSANPVLEAVKIALGFKPYAEFMDKYGNEPNEILKNIHQEFETKNKAKTDTSTTEIDVNETLVRPSFSNVTTDKSQLKSSKTPSFNDIFKNK